MSALIFHATSSMISLIAGLTIGGRHENYLGSMKKHEKQKKQAPAQVCSSCKHHVMEELQLQHSTRRYRWAITHYQWDWDVRNEIEPEPYCCCYSFLEQTWDSISWPTIKAIHAKIKERVHATLKQFDPLLQTQSATSRSSYLSPSSRNEATQEETEGTEEHRL